MSNATQHLEGPVGRRTRSCATELVCRDCGYRTPLMDQAFKCPACGEGLDIDYDYERAKETIAEVYEASEGMDDDMFNDACELVTVLGKMMKRGLGSGGGSRSGGRPSPSVTLGTGTVSQGAESSATVVPPVPPVGMENPI